MGDVADYALTRFGGPIHSEDPYAIDVAYVKYVFGIGPAAPCPRF